MKKLELSSDGYTLLLAHFTQWIELLGYSKNTVYSLPILIREFLFYLEQHQILALENIDVTIITNYYSHLQLRGNTTGDGGSLSARYLNLHQWGLKKFKEYVFKHYKITLPIQFKAEKIPDKTLEYLTVEEVKQLFDAVSSIPVKDAFKQRYKATLVLLYSCGLRRYEASSLNVEHILFERRLILVEKGKNGKQRYVPINDFNLEILRDYLLDGRFSLNKKRSNAFLLGDRGTRLSVATIGRNIKAIALATNNPDLIEKEPTAHMLRHSIATHLLDKGMEIEDISLFLGHNSLESTQIYTHIYDDDRL